MKGWGILAPVAAMLVVGGGVVAERVGPVEPAPPSAGTAASWTWLCPHGGGPGWSGVVTLANPGDEPARARITALSSSGSREIEMVTVPAGGEIVEPVPANRRESSTFVEAFGNWIAVGWMVRADDPDTGLSAEPCSPDAGTTWYTTESSTEDGEHASLIVANPFAADAVFDVVLFSPDNPPLRDPDWADLVLEGGRSLALPVSKKVVGEEAVAAIVQAKVGRVAVATLSVTEGGGVRGVLGTMTPSTVWDLPTRAGAGQSTLVTFVPGERSVRFGGTLLSQREPQAAGDLVEAQQPGSSAQVAPVITRGPSAIVLKTLGEEPLVAAQRAEGQSADDAATGGVVTPATTWVVLPTVADEPSFPGLVVVNPGAEPVTVTLRLLTQNGAPTEEISFELDASATAGAPLSFLLHEPRAAVLVSATGPVVAAGASTSAGVRGLSLYAIAVGAPVPDGTLAA